MALDGLPRISTQVSTYSLSDAEKVVVPTEQLVEFVDLDALVDEGLDVFLVLPRVVPVSAMDGTARLISLEQRSVGQYDAVGLRVGAYLVVPRGVLDLPQCLRGNLDEEMICVVLEVDDYTRGILLLFPGSLFRLVTGRHFPAGDVLATLDFQTGHSRGVGGDLLPATAVPLVDEPLVVAIEVAHLVQEGVPILFLVPIPEQGNLDAYTTSRPPIELPQLTTGVRESNFDGREFVAENFLVELIEPSLHLR